MAFLSFSEILDHVVFLYGNFSCLILSPTDSNSGSLCTRMAFFVFDNPAMQQSAKDMGLVAFISPMVLQRSDVRGSCVKGRLSNNSRRSSATVLPYFRKEM